MIVSKIITTNCALSKLFQLFLLEVVNHVSFVFLEAFSELLLFDGFYLVFYLNYVLKADREDWEVGKIKLDKENI